MQKTVESLAMQATESAYMLINCELGSEGYIIEKLKLLPSVKEARGVSGNYDILVKIQAKSLESLRDIVTFKIRKISKNLLYHNNNVLKNACMAFRHA